MAAIIGAIGLTILAGTTGQLSLAHAFFVAVGAYGYCYFAGHATRRRGEGRAASGCRRCWRWCSPSRSPGCAGALFSPISGRLRGIYLGIASIGLVFIGQHLLFNATGLTGGFNGRDAEPFSLFGFQFAQRATRPDHRRHRVRRAREAVVPRPGRSSPCRYLLRAATSSAAGPGARWRACATARSPPPSWASTSDPLQGGRVHASRRCTRAWPACCSRSPSGASCPTPSASRSRSTSW